MLKEYKTAVLKFYEEKKENNLLRDNLKEPTRARLREESLYVFNERYLEKDGPTLKAFFDPRSKYNDHVRSIENFDGDGFKSMYDFFLNQPDIRKKENIELLAWLIDFEPRPYSNWSGEITQPPQPPEPPKPPLPPRKGFPFEIKITIVIASLLLISGGGVYYFWNNETQQQHPFVDQSDCMYWAGDHYELISCNPTVGHVQNKIPFDAVEWKNLKKINCPDTLTDNDIGKVWYMKVKNDIEVYTAQGRYPLDTNRVLRPLTKYMLDQYIPRKKKEAFLEWALKGISAVAIVAFLGLIWALWAKARAKKSRLSYQ
ncbi:hypothetical protein VRU48_14565 [Pedobacter sp. KR3-3]|uniref:Uncharacterized protein n=1 Tax=Pedobacter albus TaxID=3113905 RepID=A0ABU7IA51_9SPHI|nr:hypothetical protein [Pedobacter sp. KR3-3]MEE1946345.1 hypothetical protein [Pedobacter sp. KR3-3]